MSLKLHPKPDLTQNVNGVDEARCLYCCETVTKRRQCPIQCGGQHGHVGHCICMGHETMALAYRDRP